MTDTITHAVVHAPDDVRLDPLDRPVAGPDDVVVRVAACGICGSDLGYAKAGGLPIGEHRPLPLGHEFSGTIEQVGANVTGFATGQRVTVNPTTAANMIGSGGPGAFASHILVRDAMVPDTLHALPDTIDFETAALVEPFAVALHAVNRSKAGPDSCAVVFGAGPIGLGVVAMLKLRGVGHVIAVDRVEERLERARRLGADLALNSDDDDVWSAIGKAHGASELYGYPVVGSSHFFEVSGAAPVVPDIVGNAGMGARLVVVAVHHAPVPIDFASALGKEMEIVTSLAYPDEFAEVLEILAAGRIDTDAFVSHTMPFDRFGEAFALAARPREAAKVIVTF